jgi:hypothetical protein
MLEQTGLYACGTASPSLSQEEGSCRSANGSGVREPVNRVRKRPSGPSKTVTAEMVMKSFNTWAFKREQPGRCDLMLRVIADAMAAKTPVPFVLYWGKGPRTSLAAPDAICLDFLSALARRVRETYSIGAAIELIFTDTHAGLNGHAPHDTRAYFDAVAAAARERGFSSCWLGPLTRAIEDAVTDVTVSDDTMMRLAACAAKWYRGEATAEQAALRYYQMNMVEKRAVALAFPRAIFVTFNGSEFRSLFPDTMPIFYMYSLRRGVSVKPWFMPAEAPALAASADAGREPVLPAVAGGL